jgi:hypothetical protein
LARICGDILGGGSALLANRIFSSASLMPFIVRETSFDFRGRR